MTAVDATAAFREWLAAELRREGDEAAVSVLGAMAGADWTVRHCVTNRSYYEVRFREAAGELEVGFGTEHRMVNEGIEEWVLENGGDLSELLGDELCELGVEPEPMEHFWDRPTFRYVVRARVDVPEALASDTLRRRTLAILRACRILFQDAVEEA